MPESYASVRSRRVSGGTRIEGLCGRARTHPLRRGKERSKKDCGPGKRPGAAREVAFDYAQNESTAQAPRGIADLRSPIKTRSDFAHEKSSPRSGEPLGDDG